MSINQVINLLAAVTLVELMFTIGLGATLAEVGAVLRDWRGMLAAAAANYIVVPAAAVGLVLLFHAQPIVAAGVMIVAVCPGAPYGPPFTAIARGNVGRAVGLMVLLAGSSAVLAPVLLQWLVPIVAGKDLAKNVDALKIVRTLAFTQFLPLCLGLGIVARRPIWAKLLLGPCTALSKLLNLTLLIVILAAQYRLLADIHLRGYVGMILLLLASALAGWLLGGRGDGNHKTLAITTAVRNVGVGLVIAGGNFSGTAAVTFVTAYALVQTLGTLMAVTFIGRRAASSVVPTSAALPAASS